MASEWVEFYGMASEWVAFFLKMISELPPVTTPMVKLNDLLRLAVNSTFNDLEQLVTDPMPDMTIRKQSLLKFISASRTKFNRLKVLIEMASTTEKINLAEVVNLMQRVHAFVDNQDRLLENAANELFAIHAECRLLKYFVFNLEYLSMISQLL
jgi:hypothetical protein